MSNKINPGAIVQLKSGGPIMTVERMYEVEPGTPDRIKYAECVWFPIENSQMYAGAAVCQQHVRDRFAVAVLEVVPQHA